MSSSLIITLHGFETMFKLRFPGRWEPSAGRIPVTGKGHTGSTGGEHVQLVLLVPAGNSSGA